MTDFSGQAPSIGTIHSEDGLRLYSIRGGRIDTAFIHWNGQLAFRDRWEWTGPLVPGWTVHRAVVAQPRGGELISAANSFIGDNPAMQRGIERAASWNTIKPLPVDRSLSAVWMGVPCMMHRIESFHDDGRDIWLTVAFGNAEGAPAAAARRKPEDPAAP